ncbi:hypothetical protein GQ53DRAFT_713853 [Thozetella sp. PMI_491]|nr:hypothetical protein GQ53DRAFT_713853 [Thozetella sp. PMI_491]
MAESATRETSSSSESNIVGGNRITGAFEDLSRSHPTLKRLACEACRSRKVRCDKKHPRCGRCTKMGTSCCYLRRSKTTVSKEDLSQRLVAMNSRLQQAEAQLALHSVAQNTLQDTLESSNKTLPASISVDQASSCTGSFLPPSLDVPDIGLAITSIQPTSTIRDWFGVDGSNDFDLNLGPFDAGNSFGPVLDMSPPPLEADQPAHFDPMLLQLLPTISSPHTPVVSHGILNKLHDRYFDVFHPLMPMISRRRFDIEISQPSPSIEVRALSSAMAALSSFSIPALRFHVNKYHDQCRTFLDLCERQETGESLANIYTLQALTLLTLYEFKQPNFARAWLTLGRAIRLVKLMGLGYSDAGSSSQGARWGPRLRLPPPSSPAEAEERRRTFWVLYIFDAFSTTQSNEELGFEKPTHIPLPSPSDYPDESPNTYSTMKMPSMQQIYDSDSSVDVTLSGFAATSVMVCLYRRYIEHISSQLGDPNLFLPNTFWENHYAIDKAIAHCRNNCLRRHVDADGDSAMDPRSLSMRMNLGAIEISLHETALARIREDKLPGVLAVEAASRCTLAAADIAKAVQLSRRLTGRQQEIFRQHDRSLVWPITAAIETCLMMLARKERDEMKPFIRNDIRILSSAMEDLVCPEHIRPGLLNKTNAWTERYGSKAEICVEQLAASSSSVI